MRIIFSVLMVFVCFASLGQFAPPKGFHVQRGENLTGEDDVYTNGKYSFIAHKLHRVTNDTTVNDSFKKLCAKSFGFPFFITQDGLCWGTGKKDGVYSYVLTGPI